MNSRMKSLAWSLALVAAGLPAVAQTVEPGPVDSTTLLREDFEDGAPGWSLSGNWVIVNGSNCFSRCRQGRLATLRTATHLGCKCPAWSQSFVPCSGDLQAPPVQVPVLAPGHKLVLDFCLNLYVDGGCSKGLGDCSRLSVQSATKRRVYPFHTDSPFGSSCPGPKTAPPYDLSDFSGEILWLRWTPSCVDGEGTVALDIDNVLLSVIQASSAESCGSAANWRDDGAGVVVGGSASLTRNDCTLTLVDAAPGSPAILLLGGGTSPMPWIDRQACIGGPVVHVLRAAEVASDGTVQHELDLDSAPLRHWLAPGSTWTFQFLYRDPDTTRTVPRLSSPAQLTFTP